MKRVFGNRAASILYRFLVSNQSNGAYIIPANVCAVVPFTFLKAGIPFKMVDICSEDLCMDQEQVMDLIKADDTAYQGVLYVRTYGQHTDGTKFFRELKQVTPDLKIIDDRCLCMPPTEDVDTEGADLVLYSTGTTKPADLGTGGLGFVNDDLAYTEIVVNRFDESAYKILEQSVFDALTTEKPFEYTDNKWLDLRPLQFEVEEYLMRLRQEIEVAKEEKNEVDSRYDAELNEPVLKLAATSTIWRYHLMVCNRDALLKAIFDNGAFASAHYKVLGPVFGFSSDHFPVANYLADHVINLFNYKYIDSAYIDAVIDVTNRYARKIQQPW